MELIESKHLLDATSLVAWMFDIDPEHLFNTLTRGSAQSVLLLMKSLNLEWAVVNAFLELRGTKARRGERIEAPVTRNDYESLDAGAARRVVRFMKVQQAAS